MAIFLLKESLEHETRYFIEKYSSREEAVKHLDTCFNCKFIEGEELELTLTKKNEGTNIK